MSSFTPGSGRHVDAAASVCPACEQPWSEHAQGIDGYSPKCLPRTPSAATRLYRGVIEERDYGESYDDLFLAGSDEPLARTIEDDISAHGRYLSIRYFISDTERSLEELQEALVRQIVGAGEAEYHQAYSEITGYLWTDEEINVGGHDLLEELRSHKGKFAHLEITYAFDPGEDAANIAQGELIRAYEKRTDRTSSAALSQERINSALVRVADLWPEGLDAVPGSYEVALKQDADTIRTLAAFWTNFMEFSEEMRRG